MHRFRLFRRGNGWFYSEDVTTRQQLSLRTKDRKEAQVLLSVKNEASELSMINLRLARIHLQAAHDDYLSRTWEDVFDQLIKGLKEERAQRDWERIRNSKPFAGLRSTKLFSTEKIHFQRVLRHPKASASTQQWLRRLRNYAMNIGWLLTPILSKSAWPKVRPRPRRAITSEEHRRVLAAEPDSERRLYYQMLWLLGGAQTDVAHLHSDRVHKTTQTICYPRKPPNDDASALAN